MITGEQAGAPSKDTRRLIPGHQAGPSCKSCHPGETLAVAALSCPTFVIGESTIPVPTAEALSTVLAVEASTPLQSLAREMLQSLTRDQRVCAATLLGPQRMADFVCTWIKNGILF